MARRIVLIITLALILMTAAGSPTAIAQGTEVTIEAADGLNLRGDYYESGGDGRAVLLLHQLYTTRRSWDDYISALTGAGYRVLAVDLRGYGGTRGRINWTRAQDDTQRWLAWLTSQPGVRGDAIVILGSSMGSNLAIVGCAAYDACRGAVAISPGLSYYGVRTRGALEAGTRTLLIYANRDGIPARDAPRMAAVEGFNGASIVFDGREHGMDLFTAHPDLMAQIIEWMNASLG
jgi:alpha-beta hydrolase superfamily lysophospholipase